MSVDKDLQNDTQCCFDLALLPCQVAAGLVYVMSIESDLLEDIDLSDIVCSFAENKSGKKYF